MLARCFALAVISSLIPLASLTGQETSDLQPVANWAAPPYWSPDGAKPTKDPAGVVGIHDAEVADVVPSPPMPFVAVNPCRIADTRGLGFTGQAGPPALSVGVPRVFQIGGTVTGVPAQCGIPLTAQAVSFQFSVTGMNQAGNLIAWPDGAPPTTSVLNWNANSVAIGNGIVVPLSATGGVSVQLNGTAGAITHLIIDVNGYYAPVGIVNTLNGLSGAVNLVAGTNVSITPGGQNLTIAATGGGGTGWSLTGNAGTTPGTNFLGTTDNQRLEIKVNNDRVFRLEPTLGSPNVIGGAVENNVTAGVEGATIGGGGESGLPNRVTDTNGTVGGGHDNQAGDGAGPVDDRVAATVGGGESNTASGSFSTVSGGAVNSASGDLGTVGGGLENSVTDNFGTVAGGSANRAGDNGGTRADREYGAVGGGQSNVASGAYSTVPGGQDNHASGAYSFAAGRRASAAAAGSFVWADSTNADFSTGVADSFNVRAAGGIRLFANGSTGLRITNAGSGPSLDVVNTNTTTLVVANLHKHGDSAAAFLRCTNDTTNIGTKCHIDSAGTFVAGSDFAEALPAKGGKIGYEPGDVLIASRQMPMGVEKSSTRYDTRAIGVYSTRPGVLGADKNGDTRVDADDVPVAITGIVPTKVIAENGPIEPGDLLATSSTPGHAMKAKPVSVAGIEIYPTGTILGKALEPLAGERGVIRVLVMAR
jgi:hypothetical protein